MGRRITITLPASIAFQVDLNIRKAQKSLVKADVVSALDLLHFILGSV